MSLGLVALALASCASSSEPRSKLEVVTLEKGSGPAARDGDRLSVRYFSFAYEGHRIYEDNWRQPLRFVLGEGQVADAWEEGLPGIRAGGRRELIVPGSAATPNGAPEVYVVEAVSVEPGKSTGGQAGASSRRVKGTGPKPRLRYPPKPPRHVVVRVLREGTGPRLRGMRLGGRRELIVPSRLAYGDGMMVYVIEPLEIEKRKPGRQG